MNYGVECLACHTRIYGFDFQNLQAHITNHSWDCPSGMALEEPRETQG